MICVNLMDDVSDRRSIRRVEREAKAKAERTSATLAWIMSTKPGREWMHDHLEKCHIGFTPFARDPHITAFNCGEQNIGIQLWSALQQACPDLYIMMLGEAHERSILDDTRHSRNLASTGRDDPGARIESEYEPGSGDEPESAIDTDGRGYENK